MRPTHEKITLHPCTLARMTSAVRRNRDVLDTADPNAHLGPGLDGRIVG